MLCNNITEKLLGMQDVEVKNIENKDKNIVNITLRLKRKPHKCPCCGNMTNKIHDYRKQNIKDIPMFGNNTIITLEKRRYACSCGKRFIEKVDFLPRYHRMTKRLILYVIDKFRSPVSFTYIANEVGLSVSTVIRIFDYVSYGKPELPKAIAIDEFKGNTGGEKYNCIITDPVNRRVLDILPKRKYPYLSTYFRSFNNRNDVDLFVSDMWKTYADISKTYFKKADLVIDKYHWIRQVMWAFDSVRKDVQKKLGSEYRKYFKRSRKILFKRFNELSEYQKQKVMVMLSISPNLYSAHFMKEEFFKILDCKDHKKAKELLLEWMDYAKSSNFKRFQKCADTFYNWFSGITNSLNTPVTNGFTEGCNNKIKVLKRNAYGYKNFSRFRKRILHIFN